MLADFGQELVRIGSRVVWTGATTRETPDPAPTFGGSLVRQIPIDDDRRAFFSATTAPLRQRPTCLVQRQSGVHGADFVRDAHEDPDEASDVGALNLRAGAPTQSSGVTRALLVRDWACFVRWT